MEQKKIAEVAKEAVRIYFDYSVSAREAIEKAKEMILDEKAETMEKAN